MTLREKLQKDWVSAVKEKDKIKASTISMVKAALILEDKNGSGKELNDDDVTLVLAREVKKRKEALLEFEKASREDLITQTNEEIKILLSYLPKQLTEEEIRELVNNKISELEVTGIKNMGKVMAVITPMVKGKADTKLVSDIVKELLNK